MNKIYNTKWFSIVLAMWITLVVWMISILILDLIIPFSRNIKWVENSSAAYYLWYAWVEESLWFLWQNDLWTNDSLPFTTTATGSQYKLQSTTSIIPPVWKGNSEYDTDWNRLEPNIPIQLKLNTSNINFDTATLIFRVPDLNEDEILTNDWSFPNNEEPIINWIISWLDENWSPVALYWKDDTGNRNYIRKEQINNSSFTIWYYEWFTLDWDDCELQDFYKNSGVCNWKWVDSKWELKLSLIDNLTLANDKIIPYLEYKIDFWVDIPWRYSQIETAGKSYGYRKSIDIKVPQLSTNQAFDFAVFQ